MRVLLIVAPFGPIDYPHLATGLLKAQARAAGFDCDVLYASIEFAKKLGPALYRAFYTVDPNLLIPERIFARALFGDAIPPWEQYTREVVIPYESMHGCVIKHPSGQLSTSLLEQGYETIAEDFVSELLDRPELGDYELVGFSNSYSQNMASLVLARGIKERYPDTTILFGGANCVGEMGKAILESFPWVDYVCDGDGDLAFVRFLEQFQEGESIAVPGIYSSGDGGEGTLAKGADTLGTGISQTVSDLDDLEIPDYSEYFESLDSYDDPLSRVVALPMETSRGCWWGEKHHCVFCGLNRNSMAYRMKSPERIDREIRSLIRRYGVKSLAMTDNIMGRSFVDEVLPLIGKDREHDCIFLEVKANLEKQELRKLYDAGVRHLQPGIESLSTHVLKLMDKGTNSFQNLQILKWGKELGLNVTWNMLCGFTGETARDYDEVAELIAKIHHLNPALGFSQITIDRFSPLFKTPERYGIEIRPVRGYRYVYPFAEDEVRSLAYWFSHHREDSDTATTVAAPSYARRAHQAFKIWLRMHERVDFSYRQLGLGTIEVHDTRGVACQENRELSALESRVFAALDSRASWNGLLRRLGEDGGETAREEETAQVLDRFREWSYLHEEDGKMLVLANARTEPALEIEELVPAEALRNRSLA